MLVDTGPASARDAFMHALEGHDIDIAVVTHVHEDHVGNLAEVVRRFNPEVIVHKNDAGHLTDGFAPLPCGTRLATRLLTKVGNVLMKGRGRFEPVEPSVIVDDTYDLAQHGVPGMLRHTPGHTSGSMTVMLENGECIVGDTLFNVRPFSFYPPFANDERMLCETIVGLSTCGCTTFHPGHGPPIDIEDLRSLIASRNMVD